MSVLNQFEHLKIQLEAIEAATNNFSTESCIGEGGFGKVYKGDLLHSKGHTTVAVKRLDRRFGQGDSEFWKEIIMLSVYRHENIVSLSGFCDEKDEKILVYEYAYRRSLDLHLDNKDLTWVRRLTVCIGAARGLAYLHNPAGTQQRVLHRDIKSSNILLDENWNARVADFGLSKFGPANQKYTFIVTNNMVGTVGYCDPIYLGSGILTKESDVYSLGVVLFEVLCGRLCFGDTSRPQSFTQLVRKHYKQKTLHEVIWCDIKDEIHPSSLEVFSTIASKCLKSDNQKRPLMDEIVTGLETALKYQLSTASTITHQPGYKELKPEKVDLREHMKRLETRGVDEENLVENRGVDEENLVQNLYKEIKRHVYVGLVKRVPLSKNMNARLLDGICKRLKPRLYTVVRQGDTINEIIFIMRGRLDNVTWAIGSPFGDSDFLNEGDFCGEELLTWAIDLESHTYSLPSSMRTLKALRDVEAFALPADELKFVVHHFKGIKTRHVQHTLRFYSNRWRTWAACHIQAAWRRHFKNKGELLSTASEQPGFKDLKPEKVKWLETTGVVEENLVQNLPKDERSNIKRHVCVDVVKRVPFFKYMNERLLDDICQRLKPRLYTCNSHIVRAGDPVDEMLFIMRGRLDTTLRGTIDYFDSRGDVCGEEILTWAIDPESRTYNRPSSVRTLFALTDVEAFALPADELKFVVDHLKGINIRQIELAVRSYSTPWRTLAATYIQATWRTYSKRKEELTTLSTASGSTITHQPGFKELILEKVDLQEYVKWLETRRVDKENLFQNTYNTYRDIKRHVCVRLVKQVPLFKNMNERLLDDICQRLKPRLYKDNTYIVRQGHIVDELLFITRGRLESITTFGWTSGFFDDDRCFLNEGDFSGEELLTWAIHTESHTYNLTSSMRTLKALGDVEAFALPADELRFVVHYFKGIKTRHVDHTIRFYSRRWRTWAVCYIQAAWRTYSRSKTLELCQKEDAQINGTSYRLRADMLAITFAAKVLRISRNRNRNRNKNLKFVMELMNLKKPLEPDFSCE